MTERERSACEAIDPEHDFDLKPRVPEFIEYTKERDTLVCVSNPMHCLLRKYNPVVFGPEKGPYLLSVILREIGNYIHAKRDQRIIQFRDQVYFCGNDELSGVLGTTTFGQQGLRMLVFKHCMPLQGVDRT